MSIDAVHPFIEEVDSPRWTAGTGQDYVVGSHDSTTHQVLETNGLAGFRDEGEHTLDNEPMLAGESVAIVLNGHRRDSLSPTEAASSVSDGKLSERQIQILQLIVDGQSHSASIARTLTYSESTIKNDLQEAYPLLGVDNKTAAVVQAIKLRLVNIDLLNITNHQTVRKPVEPEAAPPDSRSFIDMLDQFAAVIERQHAAPNVILSEAQIDLYLDAFKKLKAMADKVTAIEPMLSALIERSQAAS